MPGVQDQETEKAARVQQRTIGLQTDKAVPVPNYAQSKKCVWQSEDEDQCIFNLSTGRR
jgi:hypothetical protein